MLLHAAWATIARSRFVSALPTDVNEFVARACPSSGDQATALGGNVGGRIPCVDPQQTSPARGRAIFLQLDQAIGRPMRRCPTPQMELLSSSGTRGGSFRAW